MPAGVGRRHRDGPGVGAQKASASTTCSRRCCSSPTSRTSRPSPRAAPPASCSSPTSTSAAARSATILVQRGTLSVGDPLVAGPAWGRVRALIDDRGEQLKEAGPSTPVAGARPRRRGRRRRRLRRRPRREDRQVGRRDARALAPRRPTSVARPPRRPGAKLEDIFEQIQAGDVATLNLILKADVTGSLEALTESLRKLERDDVKLAFVHRAVGGITQYDVQLAATSNATIIGFNVRPDRKARELAAGRRASRSGSTRSSTRCSRTSRTPWSACSPPSSKRWSPARPRSARSSRCPASARSPAATC